MTGRDDLAAAVDAETRGATRSGRAPELVELAAYIDRVSRALPELQRVELVAALRRVWLRNRLPDSIPSNAVRDVADHCDLATITALASLGVAASSRVDPQPATTWEHPAAVVDEVPVAGWGLT